MRWDCGGRAEHGAQQEYGDGAQADLSNIVQK
jgi:hypothetical protein